jgi:hypothetical protein
MTDGNGNAVFSMPVAPAYGGSGYGGGMFGADGWWIILLLLVCGGGFGNGFGFGGGGMFPWMNTNNDVQRGFDQSAVITGITGVNNAVTSGFGNVQTALCNGFAGVNAGIANGFAQSEIAANGRQMADMNQNFALQSSFQNCCCENRMATAQTQNIIGTESAATRNTIQTGIQTILDRLCQDKIDAKNETIAQLRSELMFARGQASQDVQTAALQSGQRALANEVEQYVVPTPRPAYLVSNPSCCQQNFGCGCGA